ncbi:MAG: hypothetical protein XD73_1007 [Anaerolinea thermophila]|uniref:DUF402 domain-containing protein n=1 Tax=Anaerolinea thermophila TaxID=167964 RepID=A0A117LGN5_9CHLR|nr:MAG: hypothetical protein XD73_1007 [Anaerolinea thermophila]
MNEMITIIKKNESGEAVFEYQGDLVRKTERGLLVEAVFGIERVQVENVVFLKGDLFNEYYLFEKWFNIYEVHIEETEVIKAWYCNICRPMTYQMDSIAYEDLALDLLVYPDGRHSILDRDEFRALHINGHERRMALEGLEELVQLFQTTLTPNLVDLL